LANACLTYSVACASAAMAIGEGYRRIADGYADVMVVGGSDTPLLVGVIHAWMGMRVLAQANDESGAQACLPFDSRRSGLMLAEGAAALILEDWDSALARQATILAEMSGYGITCDHFNLVRPSELGQAQAMREALAEAQLLPSDIGYVNAHGTSTKEGDPIEIKAIMDVFGEHAAGLPVSATKASHGHMMGATGAVEAVVSILAMQRDAIPPTAHLQEIDPQCLGVRHVTGSALRDTAPRAVMSNSFAFGGSNAVLVFEAA
jgi:3-oxoacyl-[acyl-carrier-protein] synthase II